MLGHQIDDPYNSFSTLLDLSYSVWLLNLQFTLIHYRIFLYITMLQYYSDGSFLDILLYNVANFYISL